MGCWHTSQQNFGMRKSGKLNGIHSHLDSNNNENTSIYYALTMSQTLF